MTIGADDAAISFRFCRSRGRALLIGSYIEEMLSG